MNKRNGKLYFDVDGIDFEDESTKLSHQLKRSQPGYKALQKTNH